MLRASLAPLLVALAILAGGAEVEAQTQFTEAGSIRIGPAPVPTSSFESARQIEREVHAAMLSEDVPELRDAHVERALTLARGFVEVAPEEAASHYWLGVALGVRTEYSGALAKLTTGRECYEVTVRALELDPDHAGAHELLGRIHAGVMRLPWVVRKLGATLGMNDALGDASWETAEAHLRRSAELDPQAISPRLELGKLLADRGRPEESREWLALALAIAPDSELERTMLEEARGLVEAGVSSSPN